MDGSAASVSSQSSKSSPNRSKIIGGIVGGAVGLVILVLCVHCIVIAVRRKKHKARITGKRDFQDDEGKDVRMPQLSRRQMTSNDNLYVFTGETQVFSPWRTMRPLPDEPRAAPSLPPTTPYEGSRVDHETAHLKKEPPYFGTGVRVLHFREAPQSPTPPPPRKLSSMRGA